MNEYAVREIAEFVVTYWRQEQAPDYTADGLETALRWAWEQGEMQDETVAGWSVKDVLDRAQEEFDLNLTIPQAREILEKVATTDVNWDAVDYCIQQWKDSKR